MIRIFLMKLSFSVIVCSVLFSMVDGVSAEDKTTGQIMNEKYRLLYDFISVKDTIYTFQGEFTLPDGFHYAYDSSITTLQGFVANLPLWHRHMPVGIWKGGKAFESKEISRAVHIPWVGNHYRDYAFPLRIVAEFIRSQKRELNVSILPKRGKPVLYRDWLTSTPIFNARAELELQPDMEKQHSDSIFYSYLHFCMDNINYRTLAKNCDSLDASEILPGDIFVAHDRASKTGCAYMILNMIENEKGQRLFVVGSGCAEACDFHIPLFNDDRDNPWITPEQIVQLGEKFMHSGFFRLKLDQGQ